MTTHFTWRTLVLAGIFAFLAAFFVATPAQEPVDASSSGIARCTLSSNDRTITVGETATISYQLSGAARDLSVNNGVGPLSGQSGTFEVSPTKDTNYLGTFIREVLGNEVEGNCSITIFVVEPQVPQECSIVASANIVENGGSVTITWNSTGYNDVRLNGESVPASGNRLFENLTVNTTYTLTASDGKGSSCTQFVKVDCLPPVTVDPLCTLEPKTATIDKGDSVNLVWTSENGETITLEPGFSSVGPSGSQSVSPNVDTTYILTVTDKDGDEVQCKSKITVREPEPMAPQCEIFANPINFPVGGGTTVITWSTQNADAVTLDGTAVAASNAIGVSRTVTDDTTFTIIASKAGFTDAVCPVTVTVEDPTPTPKATIKATKVVCTDEAQLPNWGTGGPNITANTAADWVAANDSCSLQSGWEFQYGPTDVSDPGDTFIGAAGGDWTTFGPTGSNGVATVQIPAASPIDRLWFREVLKANYIPFTYDASPDNSDNVSAEFYCHTDVINYDNREFITNVTGGETYHCVAFNVPETPDAPLAQCVDFSATPSNLPVGGGTSILEWESLNAVSASINNGIGPVDVNGTTSVTISDDLTYTLTLLNADGIEATCPVTITVEDPNPPVFTCENSVNLSASDKNITRGESTEITWTTNDVKSLSFNTGISSTALNDSASVSPSSDTTYVMDVIFTDDTTDQCPITINVSTGGGGGGGGGSASPRCELTISERNIKRGDEIELVWGTRNASDVVIEDDRGNVIITTEDRLADDKRDLYDGDIELRPTRDTEYTLTVSRGSRERECTVRVNVEDGAGGVTVFETREQQPRVAGIALSQVPYTGFEAGPTLTFIFYALLAAWALFVAYVLVIKEDTIAGFSLAGIRRSKYEDVSAPAATPEQSSIVADYVAEATPVTRPVEVAASVTSPVVPTNLPVGDVPQFITDAVAATPTTVASDTEASLMTELEDYAHSRRVLISGDAMRYFVERVSNETDTMQQLETVIADARSQFPTEDGWLVLNVERMQKLQGCTTSVSTPVAAADSTLKMNGAGSLAEAIATGNVVAAYQMISNRPMIALADAATDFDALYRARSGEAASVSMLLKESTKEVQTEKIQDVITALTGALDGVYPDEESAVKIAIMKAIKALG